MAPLESVLYMLVTHTASQDLTLLHYYLFQMREQRELCIQRSKVVEAVLSQQLLLFKLLYVTLLNQPSCSKRVFLIFLHSFKRWIHLKRSRVPCFNSNIKSALIHCESYLNLIFRINVQYYNLKDSIFICMLMIIHSNSIFWA